MINTITIVNHLKYCSYGRRFVIVASQSLRNALLIPPTVSKEIELNISCYCILERLGRARYNGELTHGKYSLADVGGDPVLFHNHKYENA